MPWTQPRDSDLNAFALGLTSRFALRATGGDEDGERLVGTRPANHVLTGFLTPAAPGAGAHAPAASPVGSADDDDNDALAQDLPRDDAYQQTNLGLYWFVPRAALESPDGIQVHARMSVYVRRVPRRAEQLRASWSVPRDVARAHARDGGPQPLPEATIMPVWTREDLGDIVVPVVDFARLRQNPRLQIPLGEQFAAQLRTHAEADLYPGRQPFTLHEADAASEAAYDAWRASLPRGSWPLAWQPVLDLRLSMVPTEPTIRRLAVRIVNRTPAPPARALGYVDPNLYCVSLRLSIPTAARHPMTFRELPQSFRYDRRMGAVGINCNARVRDVGPQSELETESVPIHSVPRLEPRRITNAVPRFDTLGSEPVPVLRHILEAMQSYDRDEWETVIQRQTADLERTEAIEARQRFREEIARFARGIELLSDARFPNVARAFSLMNRSMERASRPRYEEWRLFQIVFIVSQLPGLAAREYPELAQAQDDDVDVLWFAAGGGKTEAFLGLILWQAFFDRLRGKALGVTAFVRFPLRLLTFQQLQRLGKALAAAEIVRRDEGLRGARFGIGYYVGQATTPNDIDDDKHARYQQHGPDAKLLRVHQCPFCGAATKLAYEATQRLVEHRCTRAVDGCPNGDQRLPIYIVDTDLYRYLPTVIVSTVDKLAGFGQNQRFAQLMGRFNVLCPDHGASFLGSNRRCSAVHVLDRGGARPERCGQNVLRYGPFHDPGPSLLIQDELHLLSEELGTFDAHYETAVAELTRSLGGKPWKVVGATATIERFKEHAWQLYLRGARQFPGPGPQAYDSFYYVQSREKIGRLFVGLVGVGRKHTPSVSRALALMYLELERARELTAQDERLACARYGLPALSKTELTQLIFLYELVLTYVLTRKGSDQIAEAIESRVKKDLRDLAPAHGELLVEAFNGGVSEAEMSAAVQRIRDAAPEGAPEQRLRGIVATNVIGHGVDVDRFNVIVFAGFPRLIAEYIQASARVGRTYPGISLFVATPQSERDRSVLDRFVKFHEYVDRLVDPSAINRWPEPAMRRTAPGVLGGVLN